MSSTQRHADPEPAFGRDGISGLIDTDRALRARDVSRPSPAEEAAAQKFVETTLARLDRTRR